MTTVTVDILDDKAFDLLKDLESLKVIRIQNRREDGKNAPVNLSPKYSGAMTKQSLEEINKQLNDLRKERD